MVSTKEDGAAKAAQELGSLSLCESVERKESDTEPTTKSGTNPTKKMCSACGKESDALKKCNGCKCVWYCDKKCQNKHRKEHKHECRRIKREIDKRGGKLDVGTEEDIGPLGKLPPQEECPICMHLMPLNERLQRYMVCCGKRVCSGCDYQHEIKNGLTCAFCRESIPTCNEVTFVQLRKRVELKDLEALFSMAMSHGYGELGLPVDQAKCIELLRQSADLGYHSAQYQLGVFHFTGVMGLERSDEKAIRYYKEAAEGGEIHALHNVGNAEVRNGNDIAAMRHWRLSASGGHKKSMHNLVSCFEDGLLHHADLAESLQAMYRSRAEMKSEHRDQHIAHLKKTGKYNAEYEY